MWEGGVVDEFTHIKYSYAILLISLHNHSVWTHLGWISGRRSHGGMLSRR